MSDTPPDFSSVNVMLHRYFFGPFSDERVRTFYTDLVALFTNVPRYAGIISDFDPSNGGVGYGLAWREDLAFAHGYPTPLDVAAWFAWNERGMTARPYCPDTLVGDWQQLEPESAYWHLSSDGKLDTNDPRFSSRIRWCLHRQSNRGPAGDAIWLDDELGISHEILFVNEIAATQMCADAIGGAFANIPYRLIRSRTGTTS